MAVRPDIEWNRPADLRAPSLARHALEHAFEIAGELRVAVVGRHRRDVFAMVAEIEQDDVEIGQEMLPERQIGVDGETIAVTEKQPRPVGIAVAPHADAGAVVERNVESLAWLSALVTASVPSSSIISEVRIIFRNVYGIN